jgi:hypothetical protein
MTRRDLAAAVIVLVASLAVVGLSRTTWLGQHLF